MALNTGGGGRDSRDSHHSDMAASDSANDKVLLLSKQLQSIGLKTNEIAIRLLNCSGCDTGQTEHHAIAMMKPTGPEEEQLT